MRQLAIQIELKMVRQREARLDRITSRGDRMPEGSTRAASVGGRRTCFSQLKLCLVGAVGVGVSISSLGSVVNIEGAAICLALHGCECYQDDARGQVLFSIRHCDWDRERVKAICPARSGCECYRNDAGGRDVASECSSLLVSSKNCPPDSFLVSSKNCPADSFLVSSRLPRPFV